MDIKCLLLGCLLLFQTTTVGLADDKIYVQDLSREGIQILSDSKLCVNSPQAPNDRIYRNPEVKCALAKEIFPYHFTPIF